MDCHTGPKGCENQQQPQLCRKSARSVVLRKFYWVRCSTRWTSCPMNYIAAVPAGDDVEPRAPSAPASVHRPLISAPAIHADTHTDTQHSHTNNQ